MSPYNFIGFLSILGFLKSIWSLHKFPLIILAQSRVLLKLTLRGQVNGILLIIHELGLEHYNFISSF